MVFTEAEKDFIRELVAFEPNFNNTVVGYAFLKKIFIDEDFALFINKRWDNGKYLLYFENINATDESRRGLYKYIDIFRLIHELEEAKYITIVKDQNLRNGKNCILLSPSVDAGQFMPIAELNSIAEIRKNGDTTESINTETGEWTIFKGVQGNGVGIGREFYPFDNDNLPLADFLYGMIFISPQLKRLVIDNFKTYEEKNLKIAQNSLIISTISVYVAIITCVITFWSQNDSPKNIQPPIQVFVHNTSDSLALKNGILDLSQKAKENTEKLSIISTQLDSISKKIDNGNEPKTPKVISITY